MGIPTEYRSGQVLYGNDLTGEGLERWFEEERSGYRDLAELDRSQSDRFPFAALNHIQAAPLRGRRYRTCLALGPAAGHDLLALGLEIERIVAIEPAREWWSDAIGGIPAEFRMPATDGTIGLPDSSVDLVVCLGVLHHIPNVEYVVSEMARVLEPGGRIIVREPVHSMGDWTRPRRGLTRHERGIPADMMVRFLTATGIRIDRRGYNGCGVTQILGRFGFLPNAYRPVVLLDMALCRLLTWNDRYWRPRLFDKVAPGAALYIGTRHDNALRSVQ